MTPPDNHSQATQRARRPARILTAMFQGGGNIPLLMPVMARLVERGHQVRIMAGPGVRRSRLPLSDGLVRRIADSGAQLIPLNEPAKHPFENAPPAIGLIGSWVPKAFQPIPREAETFLWTSVWAENVIAELRQRPADILIADFVLFGALAAAEAEHVPSVALMHTVSIRPLPGLPPYGTGWSQAGAIRKIRNAVGRRVLERIHRRNSLSHLNAARTVLGLPALRSSFDQYDRASRVLMLVNPSFDFQPRRLPSNMKHVGTPIDDASAPAWKSPWSGQQRPLVLVSLSSLNQGQTAILKRVLHALGSIDVHAIVTVGPSLDANDFIAPPNVRLERFIPHSAVLPHAEALVTQCGIGTLTKGLMAGVPLVCLPMVGDQPDNAARVSARGAGIRLSIDASPETIGAAIERIIADRRFKESAQRLGAAMFSNGNAVDNAVDAIEGAF